MDTNIIQRVKEVFLRKLEILQKSLQDAKTAQRNAPSAMESHSDTTRSEMEKLVTALEFDIYNLKKNIDKIPGNSSNGPMWKVTKINNNGVEMTVMIVPDGMGGDIIDGVRLISETTSLAKRILSS